MEEFDEEMISTKDIVECKTKEDVNKFVKNMVTNYGDINAGDGNNRTILHWAVKLGEIWLIELLLNCEKINVNAKDGIIGETPLIFACQVGDLPVVELLANYGADCEVYDDNNDSGLLWAAHNNCVSVVKFLVEEMKADTEHVYNDGRNAILWAAKRDNVDIVKYLYYHTININIIDKYNRCILDVSPRKSDEIEEFVNECVKAQMAELCLFYHGKRLHPLREKATIRIVKEFFSLIG